MMKARSFFLLSFSVLACGAGLLPVSLHGLEGRATVADWPQFRGPGGDGVGEAAADPPLEWSEMKNIAWKTAVPGRGRSSPVIVGNRIFVTMAPALLLLNQTGPQGKLA